MIIKRAFVVLPLAVLLALASSLGAQETGPTMWQCGLNPGDPPAKIGRTSDRPTLLVDTVLWREGRPIVLVRAGQPVPREIPEGQAVTIGVLDPEGKPAKGILLEWKPEGLPNLPEPFGRVRTGEDGRAVIRVGAGEGTVVWVEQEGYLPMVTTLAPAASQASLPLVRDPEIVLRVRDAYGRGLAGAELRAFPLKAMSDPFVLMSNMKAIQKQASGDETGRVPLPAGLEHAAGGLLAPGCSLEEIPSLDAARVVVLKPAAAVMVSARDALTKKPVKNVKVESAFSSVHLPVLVFRREARWAQGSGTVSPGAYPCRLTLSAEGRVPTVVELKEPPAGGPLEVLLETGVVLAGFVTDAGGKGISGATVGVGKRHDDFHETAKDGAFELPPLARSGAPYTLEAGADGYLDREITDLPAQDNRALRVVLERGATVRGRVLDEETRQPVPDAKVTFHVQGSSSSRGVSFDAKLDQEGAFAEGGLDPGSYTVRAYAKGGSANPVTVAITATEPHDLGDLLLSGHPAVKGVLALPGGETLSANPSVRLERFLNFKEVVTALNARSLEGSIDAEGAFVIRGAAAGRYRLVASDGIWKKTVAPVAVESEDVDLGNILLEKPCSLRGRVVRTDGRSASSWRITLATQAFDFDPPTAFTEEDGAFDFEDLAPGAYRLQAYPPLKLMPEADQRVELAPGQEAEVIVPVGGVTVTAFVQVEGRPAGAAEVSLIGQSDAVFESGVVVMNSEWGKVVLGLPSIAHRGESDATGQITIEGVSPGLNQAMLHFNDMEYKMPVTIPPSPQAPLTWNFRGMELRGTVLDPQGSGAPKILVALGYQGVGANPANTAFTDGEGNFRMTGLGAGTVLLGCRNEGGLTATATVTLTAGKAPEPVVMKLGAGAGK